MQAAKPASLEDTVSWNGVSFTNYELEQAKRHLKVILNKVAEYHNNGIPDISSSINSNEKSYTKRNNLESLEDIMKAVDAAIKNKQVCAEKHTFLTPLSRVAIQDQSATNIFLDVALNGNRNNYFEQQLDYNKSEFMNNESNQGLFPNIVITRVKDKDQIKAKYRKHSGVEKHLVVDANGLCCVFGDVDYVTLRADVRKKFTEHKYDSNFLPELNDKRHLNEFLEAIQKFYLQELNLNKPNAKENNRIKRLQADITRLIKQHYRNNFNSYLNQARKFLNYLTEKADTQGYKLIRMRDYFKQTERYHNGPEIMLKKEGIYRAIHASFENSYGEIIEVQLKPISTHIANEIGTNPHIVYKTNNQLKYKRSKRPNFTEIILTIEQNSDKYYFEFDLESFTELNDDELETVLYRPLKEKFNDLIFLEDENNKMRKRIAWLIDDKDNALSYVNKMIEKYNTSRRKIIEKIFDAYNNNKRLLSANI